MNANPSPPPKIDFHPTGLPSLLEKEWLTKAETAELLGVTERTVRRMRQQGRIQLSGESPERWALRSEIEGILQRGEARNYLTQVVRLHHNQRMELLQTIRNLERQIAEKEATAKHLHEKNGQLIDEIYRLNQGRNLWGRVRRMLPWAAR